jgi:hypothetical protein
MTARLHEPGRRSLRHLALAAVTGLMVFGTVACSSDTPTTEVQGEVLSRPDDLGGPNPAVAEFRSGERSVYGVGAN